MLYLWRGARRKTLHTTAPPILAAASGKASSHELRHCESPRLVFENVRRPGYAYSLAQLGTVACSLRLQSLQALGFYQNQRLRYISARFKSHHSISMSLGQIPDAHGRVVIRIVKIPKDFMRILDNTFARLISTLIRMEIRIRNVKAVGCYLICASRLEGVIKTIEYFDTTVELPPIFCHLLLRKCRGGSR
jgi:hypothetical protein